MQKFAEKTKQILLQSVSWSWEGRVLQKVHFDFNTDHLEGKG